MFSEKEYLKEEMEDLREKLNQAISKGENKIKILYLSQKLDKLLDIYYKHFMNKKEKKL
ncbi:Spo0E family sporulation regulatory protein-aspartic acid phosphatase [Clostridium sp. D2Q-11]|uniref:Spo0E family sporulation regulatory protein-aspartic acid phosphatase n=2 Tax=Anaeromonas frigoriresistens TaxID=2683708 RepID=A0A942UVY0_9FIRM|nr:Spo0E family sporulation regulatory protein-aspartic acid phosphatase [Anaeromonas frigoriresistens]